jgi:hypothetical protein
LFAVCGPEPAVHKRIAAALVTVDLRRAGAVKLGAIADYVAMLVLSEPRFPDRCQTLPSVIDMFSACPGRPAPDGLTAADFAYLTAVYSADLSITQTRLQGPFPPPRGNQSIEEPTLDQVAGRMAALLKAAGPPPTL